MEKANDGVCFYNGHFIPIPEAGIPLNDLGVQRGYGIFDFLRINNHTPLYIDDHLSRFFASAADMRLPLLYTKEEIKNIIFQLIKTNRIPDAGIRIMLTGGISKDGYTIESPNMAILLQSITAPVDTISLSGCKLISYAHQRQLPHIKTTDYLMAIWLQPRLIEQQADDILYYHQDSVLECPRSNFFLVLENNTIVTPKENVLKGITRKHVLQVALANKYSIEEREIKLSEIHSAKEAFITSSTKRIIPITQIDKKIFETYSKESISCQLFTHLLIHEKELNKLDLNSTNESR